MTRPAETAFALRSRVTQLFETLLTECAESRELLNPCFLDPKKDAHQFGLDRADIRAAFAGLERHVTALEVAFQRLQRAEDEE